MDFVLTRQSPRCASLKERLLSHQRIALPRTSGLSSQRSSTFPFSAVGQSSRCTPLFDHPALCNLHYSVAVDPYCTRNRFHHVLVAGTFRPSMGQQLQCRRKSPSPTTTFGGKGSSPRSVAPLPDEHLSSLEKCTGSGVPARALSGAGKANYSAKYSGTHPDYS